MRITKNIVATIAALEDRRGRLTPQQVVEEARPKNSLLHSCFEWNDSSAANSWRIEQARTLIKRVKIVIQVEHKKIRTVAYVRDSQKEVTEPGYISLMKIRIPNTREVMAEELERVTELLERAAAIAMVKHEELPHSFADKITNIQSIVKGLQATL